MLTKKNCRNEAKSHTISTSSYVRKKNFFYPDYYLRRLFTVHFSTGLCCKCWNIWASIVFALCLLRGIKHLLQAARTLNLQRHCALEKIAVTLPAHMLELYKVYQQTYYYGVSILFSVSTSPFKEQQFFLLFTVFHQHQTLFTYTHKTKLLETHLYVIIVHLVAQ